MTNHTGNWASVNLPVVEEFYAAMEQMSLGAGAAGDSVKETGNLTSAAPSIDVARARVARAAAPVRYRQIFEPNPERNWQRFLLMWFRSARRPMDALFEVPWVPLTGG